MALATIRERLLEASSVVLTTHVNPDGDGLGSMVALANRLDAHGVEATIVTPSRPPTSLGFVTASTPLFVADDPAAEDPLNRAEAIAILDTAERKRLGALPPHIDRVGGVLVDHHPAVGPALVEPSIRDDTACATGELIFDLLALDERPLSGPEADALYVAIATDTGSFQFSNTSSRTHRIAAALVDAGVDPGAMYRALYGVYTRGKLALIKLGLERLEVDPRAPVAWIAVDHKALSETGARGEDMEGLVEFPRRLQGIEVGILFRGLAAARTKVSLRSNGEVDVSVVAQRLGGGGHTKASGAVLELGLEPTIQAVMDELRPAVDAATGAPSEG
ncbi:MAG: bifunctional oligoribonuclease/PAP phosphatase NrnA [Gemmatimonadetes bacterium]|nr:bifunctional oligoribonuclease/PAP phosphatase NrnA [Gemmatimonadota bacterium]